MRREYPVQVTLRICEGLPSLRARPAWAVVVKVMRAMRARAGFRIVQFSVLSNHLHAIVEADDAATFSSAMRSLTIRLARALNRLWQRHGKVLEHRFHARALRSPSEVARSLAHVLLNARKHAAQRGRQLPPDWVDPRSTGVRFDGWARPPRATSDRDFGVSAPQTWLLRHGWRRCGLLALDAVPGGVDGPTLRGERAPARASEDV